MDREYVKNVFQYLIRIQLSGVSVDTLTGILTN